MKFLDIISGILWFGIPFLPILSVSFVIWKYRTEKLFVSILLKTIIISLVLSIFLYFISLSIIFRDGMGA